MWVPGGGTSCLGVGRPGSGALPPPTTRPFGRAAGAHYPLAVGAGGAGVKICHQPHSARSCELALRAVGVARERPGGGTLAWVWGVRRRPLFHPQPLVLSGVQQGPASHLPWVGCAGVGAGLSLPTCSFESGTSHSGFPRFNPVDLGRGAVEPLNRGSTAVEPLPALAAAAAPAARAFLNKIYA